MGGVCYGEMVNGKFKYDYVSFYGTESYSFSQGYVTEANIVLTEGQYVEILHSSVSFTPYITSFQFK